MVGTKKLLLDVVSTVGVRLFALPLSLASSIIMARALHPEGRGLYTTAMTLGELAVVFGGLGLTTSALYYLARPSADTTGLLASSLGAVIIVGGAISLFLLGGPELASLVSARVHLSLAIVLVIAPFGLLSVLRSTLETFLRAQHRVQAINVGAIVASLYYLGLIALLAGGQLLTSASAVAARVSMAAVGAFVAYLFLSRGGVSLPRPRFDRRVTRQLMAYGVPYSVFTIFLMLSYRLDYLLLALWKTQTDVGRYSVSVAQAELLWILPVSVGFVLFPRTASRSETQRPDAAAETASLARWAVLLTLVSAAVLAGCARPLTVLMYGRDYEAAVLPLWLLLPGVVANVWLQILGPYLFGIARASILIRACAAGFVANLSLNAVLIPRFASAGAAAASSMSYTVTAVLLVVAFWRLHRDSRLNVFFPSLDEIGSRLRSVRSALARA